MFNLFMSILLLANNSLARHGNRAFTLRGVLLTAPLPMFSSEMIIAKPNPSIYLLEKGPATKSDAFSEKFQTALNPPPLIFGKLCCKFFMTDMVAYMRGGMMAR